MTPKQWHSPPENALKPDTNYTAIIHTDLGAISFELYADKTPITVNNFVFLTSQGFYDNTVFHRVIDDFMVQGGDPTGTGTGGPGYHFQDEFNASLKHDKRGVLSMANAGPNTNGSQFFITHLPTPWLDNKHTVFGQLIGGENIFMSIPARDPMDRNAPAVKITSIEIVEQ